MTVARAVRTILQYEWDRAKRQTNLDKHDVDFTSMVSFEWATAVTERSDRHTEIRFLSIGYIGDRLHTVVYTVRSANIRLISLRRASRREERRYAQT